MERDEWVRHCSSVSRLLRQIREQSVLPFTPEEESHFQESMDANELGIAFDFLCWTFEKMAGPISQPIYDMIADAGSRMECSPGDWERLKAFIR